MYLTGKTGVTSVRGMSTHGISVSLPRYFACTVFRKCRVPYKLGQRNTCHGFRSNISELYASHDGIGIRPLEAYYPSRDYK